MNFFVLEEITSSHCC